MEKIGNFITIFKVNLDQLHGFLTFEQSLLFIKLQKTLNKVI